MLFYGEKKMRMAQATPARMKGKSDGGETCAKCFELKMRIPIEMACSHQCIPGDEKECATQGEMERRSG